jgi:ABC-2 type transport system ATP-binding protein
MRSLAAEGRTVFVSSHLMSEMEHTADHLVVIGRGKLIAEAAVTDFIAGSTLSCVQVRTPQRDELELAVIAAGGTVQPGGGGELEVRGLDVAQVGEIAHHNRILLQLLAPARASPARSSSRSARSAPPTSR